MSIFSGILATGSTISSSLRAIWGQPKNESVWSLPAGYVVPGGSTPQFSKVLAKLDKQDSVDQTFLRRALEK